MYGGVSSLWALHLVDDIDLDRCGGALEFQADLLLKCGENVRPSFNGGRKRRWRAARLSTELLGSPFKLEIELAAQACLIDDRPIEDAGL